MKPFFVTAPHSGERIAPETTWLKDLPERVLMCDVDRFVDQLYGPGAEQLKIPFVVTEWHRYVVDLNRLPEDVDQDVVRGHSNPSGTFPQGLHWFATTRGQRIMPEPMSKALHETLVQLYFEPFHSKVRSTYESLRGKSAVRVFHLDAHSMPSMGTSAHRDPGQRRAEIVVSDCDGKSCGSQFKDLVMESYRKVGFEVAYNWPYKGGRVTQTYGRPEMGQEAIQVEMRRDLYMDEETRACRPEMAREVTKKITQVLSFIYEGL